MEYLLVRTRARDHMLAPSEAFMLLGEADAELLDVYFRVKNAPDPTDENAADILSAHRCDIESTVAGIRDRAHAIVEQLDREETAEFSYLTLRKRVLEHRVEQPEAFRKLPPPDR